MWSSGPGLGVLEPGGATNYDLEFYDGPTTVHVNTMIRSISKIDDYKMVRTERTDVGLSKPPPGGSPSKSSMIGAHRIRFQCPCRVLCFQFSLSLFLPAA